MEKATYPAVFILAHSELLSTSK